MRSEYLFFSDILMTIATERDAVNTAEQPEGRAGLTKPIPAHKIGGILQNQGASL